MASDNQRFFAPAGRGIASVLREELLELGANSAREHPAGVAFEGDLATAYRACLWSRTASRVLLPLAELQAPDPDRLYAGIGSLDWSAHLGVQDSLAVDFATSRSAITHSRYGAQRVKDAIVDQLRSAEGARPSVDTARPDLRVNVYLFKDQATVSVDLAGEALHRRGYRSAGGEAPLKENLAAAILIRAGWPEVAARGGPLVDPLCGSGTLLIEAALMAGDAAPGLLREYFGFMGWRGHQSGIWAELLSEARQRRERGAERIPPLYGYDASEGAVRAARANAAAAGVGASVQIARRELALLRAPAGPPGLLVTNPPYGERMGDAAGLAPLYAELGRRLRQGFAGWGAAVFTGNPELGKTLALRAERRYPMSNGPIACKLLRFQIRAGRSPGRSPEQEPGPGNAFADRLRKNLRTVGAWARREGITCYRLYDADMPEYAMAVDLYRGRALWAHVQEYAPPASIDPDKASLRRHEALAVLPGVLDTAPANVFFKVRRRQKGRSQYQRLAAEERFFQVAEGGCRFLVNLSDYLDTGLFLDHRPTRALIRELAPGGRFLNLFAYTGTATVCAGAGGAAATTTVDLSQTYLDWARRNLALNGLQGSGHRLVQADCLQWLAGQRPGAHYDLIFLDPPTFSTSKRMQGTFDVQRDHVELIRRAAALLAPEGVLLFSNNLRRFRMEAQSLAELAVEDIGARTIPRDFARSPRIHGCWRITRR